MYIRFGTRLFGSTDSVSVGIRNGEDKKLLFHVATQFFHINYVPLFPFGSYLVLDFLQANRSPCILIPISWKSVGIAWLRMLSWLSVFILVIFLLAGEDTAEWTPALEYLPFLIAAVVCSILVTWNGFFNSASHGRAMELLELMNLEPRHAAGLGRLVESSFSSECSAGDIGEGEFEAMARAMPTATAELVDGSANDLELMEGSGGGERPSDDAAFVPTAVAVAQPTMAETTEITYEIKGAKADVPFDNENEGRFRIV